MSQTNIGTCASGAKEAEASMNYQPARLNKTNEEYQEWRVEFPAGQGSVLEW